MLWLEELLMAVLIVPYYQFLSVMLLFAYFSFVAHVSVSEIIIFDSSDFALVRSNSQIWMDSADNSHRNFTSLSCIFPACRGSSGNFTIIRVVACNIITILLVETVYNLSRRFNILFLKSSYLLRFIYKAHNL